MDGAGGHVGPQLQDFHHRPIPLSIVGTGLMLPLDVEPYGPGDREYGAARRLLRRSVENTGRRLAS